MVEFNPLSSSCIKSHLKKKKALINPLCAACTATTDYTVSLCIADVVEHLPAIDRDIFTRTRAKRRVKRVNVSLRFVRFSNMITTSQAIGIY